MLINELKRDDLDFDSQITANQAISALFLVLDHDGVLECSGDLVFLG